MILETSHGTQLLPELSAIPAAEGRDNPWGILRSSSGQDYGQHSISAAGSVATGAAVAQGSGSASSHHDRARDHHELAAGVGCCLQRQCSQGSEIPTSWLGTGLSGFSM